MKLNHGFGCAQVWDKGEGLIALEPINTESIAYRPADAPRDLALNLEYRKLEIGGNAIFPARIDIEA